MSDYAKLALRALDEAARADDLQAAVDIAMIVVRHSQGE